MNIKLIPIAIDGKEYKVVPEQWAGTCVGCAGHNDNVLCHALPLGCSHVVAGTEVGHIYVEVPAE